MPRFFLPVSETDSFITVTGDNARHIGRSLRMKIGEELTVTCKGVDYLCSIYSMTEDTVTLSIISAERCQAEPDVNITLYQALPKSDKLEFIIQKSVELGVSSIVPVLTRRCVSRPSEKDFSRKLIRLEKIAHEASKQSGRGIIPNISHMMTFKDAVNIMRNDDCAVILYENGGVHFSETGIEKAKNISIMVGSEGGFDEEEAEYAKSMGIIPVWLGKRILRCETAPITALSIAMFLTKNI
ncbi:MAG: RsmE family RNA methyltransferase [Oscillospiraceae bacterium]